LGEEKGDVDYIIEEIERDLYYGVSELLVDDVVYLIQIQNRIQRIIDNTKAEQ
jgi:hypothetical protein